MATPPDPHLPPEHNALLVRLDDAVRPLGDPYEITQTAARLLGTHLKVNRCAYADVEPDQDTFNLTGDYNHEVQSIVGRYRFAQFGNECLRLMREGRPYVVVDSETDSRTAVVRESYRMTKIRSVICVSVRKDNRFVAAMAVHQVTPRAWTDEEVELVQSVANRSWESIERGRVLRALAESESRFRQLADALPQIVWVTDAAGRVEYFNQRWYDFTGETAAHHSEVAWDIPIHPEDRAHVHEVWQRSVATGQLYEIEFRAKHQAGHYRWMLGRALPVRTPQNEIARWFGTWTDIDDQKQAAELLEQRVRERTDELRRSQVALVQAQKLEAVGRLAGGVAHDFNNMITGVLGIVEDLREKLGPDTTDGQELTEASNALNKAANLTRQLLAFSRQQVHTPRPMSLNAVTTDMNQLLRRLLPEDIKIQTTLDPSLGTVRADPTAVQQVILNLVLNARDAMPRGGTLTIETRNVELGDEYVKHHFDVPPGPYVALEIRDTGEGMTPEVMAHVFEPFFTTKDLGKGTGLGLATVYGIVKQAHGDIHVSSELGRGSVFRVLFPRIETPVENILPPSASLNRGGTERIVVVEDEDIVRHVTVKALRNAGYSVLEAVSGAQALELFADGHAIDLLLTDVVMPGMDGHALAQKLQEKYPKLAVLYMSGYDEGIVAHKGVLATDLSFIEKSFSAQALCRKVREVLDARPR